MDCPTGPAGLADGAPSDDPFLGASRRGQRELLRLGGASLPHLLPRLDSLAPRERVRVALSLAPLVARMGLDHQGEPEDPERVVLFWSRFWDTRGIEGFRSAL